MPDLRVDVRRHSTPEVDPPPLVDRFGKILGDITGWAFRFNVMRDLPDIPGTDTAQPPILLMSVIPSILSGPDSTIRITLGLQQTGFEPGEYRAELIWREDGTDPVFPEAPDDFTPAAYIVVREAEEIL
jgi:hypothetical protein